MAKRIHVLKFEHSESSLFNRYSEHCLYIDADTHQFGSIKICEGQQFGALTYNEEYKQMEKVTLPQELVDELLKKREISRREYAYKSALKDAGEQNEVLKDFPMPGNHVEVIGGRKFIGRKGIVIKYVNDKYPTNTGNYLTTKLSNGLGWRGKSIMQYISKHKIRFIEDKLRPIYGKSLMCKDVDTGETFFVKPKYVTTEEDNRKSQTEMEEFARKSSKHDSAPLSSLWETTY